MAKTEPTPNPTTKMHEKKPVEKSNDQGQQSSEIAIAKQVEVWITEPLKQAAKALQKSWNLSHDDQMAALNIRDVELKFTGAEQRGAFLEALEKSAKLINVNFPSTYPLPKPNATGSQNTDAADGIWMHFWWKYFLPDAFDVVMQDVAATELNTIPASADILKQAQAYLNAFTVPFVRMELAADEGMYVSVVGLLTESLREAQNRLVKFLKLLVESMPEPGVHRVIIRGENQIEVDGKPTEFKGAALRALLSLALLRDQSEFKVQMFAKNYHGGDVVEARHDFDNALDALKKKLPGISPSKASSENYRKVSGLKFLVLVDDAAISKQLRGLYKTPAA